MPTSDEARGDLAAKVSVVLGVDLLGHVDVSVPTTRVTAAALAMPMQLLESTLFLASQMRSLSLFCFAQCTLRLCIRRAPVLLVPLRKPRSRLLMQHPGLLPVDFVEAFEALARVEVDGVSHL